MLKQVTDPIAGSLWHADHVIPVAQGGGQCSLLNLRSFWASYLEALPSSCRANRPTPVGPIALHLDCIERHVDHVIPVAQGGGQCSLLNLRSARERERESERASDTQSR